MDNWKIIMNSSSVEPFEIYLESKGIETPLQNELAAQVYPSAVDEVKLLVNETDFEKGIEILIEGDK